MRRIDKAMSPEEIVDFLKENQVGHLATIDEKGYPYVIPVNYCYEEAGTASGSGRFILHSALQGKKLDNIRANPKACFEVSVCSGIVESDSPCEFTVRYKSVVAFGKAYCIEDESKADLLGRFVEKLAGGFTGGFAGSGGGFGSEEIGKVAVIVMKVEHVTGKASGG